MNASSRPSRFNARTKWVLFGLGGYLGILFLSFVGPLIIGVTYANRDFSIEDRIEHYDHNRIHEHEMRDHERLMAISDAFEVALIAACPLTIGFAIYLAIVAIIIDREGPGGEGHHYYGPVSVSVTPPRLPSAPARPPICSIVSDDDADEEDLPSVIVDDSLSSAARERRRR